MEKIILGRSGVKVTPVTFGAWAIGGWMWGGADRDDAIEAIETAIDLGVTSIDTAPVYGFGRSEEIVGEVIRGKRDKVEILTKYGLRWDTSEGEFYFDTVGNDGKPLKIHKFARKESVIEECERSLQRLGTDYIDLYQIHWPDGTTPIAETMEAVTRLIEQGKVRAAGVCNYSAAQCNEAHEVLPLASNQVPFSMVKRDIEKDQVPWCIDHHVSILAYSPLQRGLLTGKITPDYKFGEGDSRPSTAHFKPENIRRVNAFLDEIRPIAEARHATLSQLVINWTLTRPGITVALVGARNRKQMEDNAGALSFELSLDEVEAIDHGLSKLNLLL